MHTTYFSKVYCLSRVHKRGQNSFRILRYIQRRPSCKTARYIHSSLCMTSFPLKDVLYYPLTWISSAYLENLTSCCYGNYANSKSVERDSIIIIFSVVKDDSRMSKMKWHWVSKGPVGLYIHLRKTRPTSFSAHTGTFLWSKAKETGDRCYCEWVRASRAISKHQQCAQGCIFQHLLHRFTNMLMKRIKSSNLL